jgi:hypothetical protein
MNTPAQLIAEGRRRAEQFADALIPDDLWFLAYDYTMKDGSVVREAERFTSQADLIEYVRDYGCEVVAAMSSCLDKTTGVRVQVTHNRNDVAGWVEDMDREAAFDRAHIRSMQAAE